MNRLLVFLSIAIFSIFLGSQITEGVLLLPYWKTLSGTEFYDYYAKCGPIIDRFYTILTVLAVLIPLSTSIYSFFKKPHALILSLISTFFAFLVIVLFYLYFKDANQQFYEAVLDTNQLNNVLENWEYWHWIRVLCEIISLSFLILFFNNLETKFESET